MTQELPRRAAPDWAAIVGRDVVALLGLVFDRVTLESAAEQLRQSAAHGTRCFISTPNVNFAASAVSDREFRESVLGSDLSLVDGAPLVWLSKTLGARLVQRVSGADLFEQLRRGDNSHPLRIFFFGGSADVAARAAEVVNAENGGMLCVGFHSPGFGDLDTMSTPPIIGMINRSAADFVVVSLGAKKGQAWIRRNQMRLSPPLICHLGAVINFVAGTVTRAPPAWRRMGLEWLWRIKEEPALARRYIRDAAALLRLWCAAVAWHVLASWATWTPATPPTWSATQEVKGTCLRLGGSWSGADQTAFRLALGTLLDEGACVIDLSAVTDADPSLIGLLALVDQRLLSGRLISAQSTLLPRLRARFRACGMSCLIEHLHA